MCASTDYGSTRASYRTGLLYVFTSSLSNVEGRTHFHKDKSKHTDKGTPVGPPPESESPADPPIPSDLNNPCVFDVTSFGAVGKRLVQLNQLDGVLMPPSGPDCWPEGDSKGCGSSREMRAKVEKEMDLCRKDYMCVYSHTSLCRSTAYGRCVADTSHSVVVVPHVVRKCVMRGGGIHHGPTIGVIECPKLNSLKSGIGVLNDFPCVSIPCNARDSHYQQIYFSPENCVITNRVYRSASPTGLVVEIQGPLVKGVHLLLLMLRAFIGAGGTERPNWFWFTRSWR
ncbi:hypothetical protein IFM89_024568 [Coptis chinensis]|uniref:Uncharacterized protein n=1 Tax=Coptis chinensis TaxID=261450 RepID=A0A835LWC8_9MAGN|nr:hypothetical protein IFM89_024568 [Coptis chinensis]